MAVPWAWAFDTPFKWTKQIASHFGGTRQGMTIAWPAVIKDKGGIRTQFHHMIDIAPTILEATRIKAPDTVNGIKQAPIEGVSMMYTFDRANTNAPSGRTTQYFEMGGYRGIYHEGWYAATTPPISPWSPVLNMKLPDVLSGYKWELYKLTDDYSQANDLAAKNPDKLAEFQKLFLQEAAKYQVFPLDNRAFVRVLTPRPSATAGINEFTYTGVLSGIPAGNAPPYLGRSFTITADIQVPPGGAEGMLATQGGETGGYDSMLSRASQSSPTICSTWSDSVGRRRRRCRRAGIQSSLNLLTRGQVLLKVARASSRSMVRKRTPKRFRALLHSPCHSTKPLMLASIRAPASIMPTTVRHSALPARLTS